MEANPEDKRDSEVISIVAHDLKSPVTAARGFLDLVDNAGELNETQKMYLDRAFKSLDRMQQLISSLLDWSRLQSGEPLELRVVDLMHLIHDTVSFMRNFANQREISIRVETSEEKVWLPADNRLLEHVVSNLVSNAIKYNRDGGEVVIRVSRMGADVRVDVIDTGIGIEPKDQARVFERFYRASRKRMQGSRRVEGTGLGLAISQAVVGLHGGQIWVESEPGEGSVFSFTLPVQARPQDSSPSPDEIRHSRFGGFHLHQSGEIIDDVDDDLQERPERAERESRRDDV